MTVIIDGQEYVPKPKVEPKTDSAIPAEICDKCGGDSKVIDTRFYEVFNKRLRRRECLICKNRWSTYEIAIRKR